MDLHFKDQNTFIAGHGQYLLNILKASKFRTQMGCLLLVCFFLRGLPYSFIDSIGLAK